MGTKMERGVMMEMGMGVRPTVTRPMDGEWSGGGSADRDGG